MLPVLLYVELHCLFRLFGSRFPLLSVAFRCLCCCVYGILCSSTNVAGLYFTACVVMVTGRQRESVATARRCSEGGLCCRGDRSHALHPVRRILQARLVYFTCYWPNRSTGWVSLAWLAVVGKILIDVFGVTLSGRYWHVFQLAAVGTTVNTTIVMMFSWQLLAWLLSGSCCHDFYMQLLAWYLTDNCWHDF